MENIIKRSFDELVFENRNKDFGAYFLRQLYSNNIVIAFVASLFAFTLAISAPVIYKTYFQKAEEIDVMQQVEIDLQKIEMEEPVEEIPPPPIEIPKPEIATVKFLPPEVKPDEQVKEEEVPTEDELKDATASNETHEGVKGDNIGLSEEVVEAAAPEPVQEEVLAYVPVQAEFEGGNAALIKFLSSQIQYPTEAQTQGISGDVWVQFTVNLDGTISDAKIYKGLGYGCDEEALRAVKKLPSKWTPGKVNGVSKRSKRKVRIHFGF